MFPFPPIKFPRNLPKGAGGGECWNINIDRNSSGSWKEGKWWSLIDKSGKGCTVCLSNEESYKILRKNLEKIKQLKNSSRLSKLLNKLLSQSQLKRRRSFQALCIMDMIYKTMKYLITTVHISFHEQPDKIYELNLYCPVSGGVQLCFILYLVTLQHRVRNIQENLVFYIIQTVSQYYKYHRVESYSLLSL